VVARGARAGTGNQDDALHGGWDHQYDLDDAEIQLGTQIKSVPERIHLMGADRSPHRGRPVQ
jgi:hypothetical protein